MPKRSSVEAIHLIRSLIEKYMERQRDIHMAFLDLEKAYDIVPRELIWKTLVEKGTSRRYIRVIRDMYDGAKTHVRTSIGSTEFFLVDVALHQGLTISPYLFALIHDGLSRGIQEDIPWEIAHNEEVDICIRDKILQPKESFWYLESMMHKSRRIDEDIANRIKAAWMKWRAATIVLCDRNVPPQVKGVQLKVESIINKMREVRLRWFEHVKRRPQSAPVSRVEALLVDELRRWGKPKLSNKSFPAFCVKNVGSTAPLEKCSEMMKLDSMSYHARGACLRP
nr:hypothetical protein [Tanacetum cinerariifolium]